MLHRGRMSCWHVSSTHTKSVVALLVNLQARTASLVGAWPLYVLLEQLMVATGRMYVDAGKVKCFATLVKITAAKMGTIFSLSSHCICLCRVCVCVKQIALLTGWHPS